MKIKTSTAGRLKLPKPLSWADLCECGAERRDHNGRHGIATAANGCPSFKGAR